MHAAISDWSSAEFYAGQLSLTLGITLTLTLTLALALSRCQDPVPARPLRWRRGLPQERGFLRRVAAEGRA